MRSLKATEFFYWVGDLGVEGSVVLESSPPSSQTSLPPQDLLLHNNAEPASPHLAASHLPSSFFGPSVSQAEVPAGASIDASGLQESSSAAISLNELLDQRMRVSAAKRICHICNKNVSYAIKH